MQLLVLYFFVSMLFPTSSIRIYHITSLMYHLTLQMIILDIVPGKPKMFLQENFGDCLDCGVL